MSLQAVINGVWYAGICLMGVLVAGLLAKKMWKKFPIFTAYSVVCLSEALVLFFLYPLKNPFFYAGAYWAFESVSMLLGVGVVYELFKTLFAPYAGLRRLASHVFYWGLLGLMLLGFVAVYFQSAVAGHRFAAAFVVVEEAARIIEVGLIMFLFLFSNAFGLHWRQYIFGIAFGLGIFITVALTGIVVRAHYGPSVVPGFNLARLLAFDLSLAVWATYLLLPEKEPKAVAVPERGQLEQWNQAVMELIHQ